MTRPLMIALVALGTAAASLAALPQGQPGDGPPRRPNVAALQREAGLTDAQASQLRKLMQDERKLAIRRRADLQVARLELDELLDAASVDEKAVGARVKALADLQAAALKARVDHRLAVRKVVTAEQLEKMKMLHRGPRPRAGREWRRPGPGPQGGPGFGRPPGPDGPPNPPRPDADRDDDEVD